MSDQSVSLEVEFGKSGPPNPPATDRSFLLALDRQLADAVTFLPPAMRASFHAQIGALIRMTTRVTEINHGRAINGIERAVEEWRIERERIAERTGG